MQTVRLLRLCLIFNFIWYTFTKQLVRIFLVPLKWFGGQKRYQRVWESLDTKIDTFYQESVKMKREYRKLGKVAVVTLLQLLAYYSFSVLFLSFTHSQSKLVLAMFLWRFLTYYFGIFTGMFALLIKPDKVEN